MSHSNPFKIGVRFEADDLRNTRKVCVASVADVLNNRILVHFDGWDDRYDYWVDCNSPYIHPVNWHLKNNFEIVPPPDWKDIFDWQTYLDFIRGIAAPEDYFQTREPIAFNVGMKLEVVDKKNTSLIRPATVILIDGYEVKVLFDGWAIDYAFWVVDDSPDIHPVGWCEATGHDLEPPPEYEHLPAIMPCPLSGCRGIGNAKRYDIDFHATDDSCPYLPDNWKKELERPERISYKDITTKDSINNRKRNYTEINNSELCSKFVKTEIIEDENSQSKYSFNVPQFDIDKKPKLEENINNTTSIQQQSKLSSIDPRIQLAKQLLCDYGPRLEQNYKIWLNYAEHITNEKIENLQQNPLNWSVDEVVKFLNKKLPNLKEIFKQFYKEDIDGEALLSLRQRDLTDILKIKLGTAIKIYNLIILLRTEVINNYS